MPPIAEGNVRNARAFLAANREADAAACLEQSPSFEARDLHREICTRAARAALDQNERSAAAAWLDRGLALTPADPVLNFFRGNLHQDAGLGAAAVACFRHCVTADPQREEFAVNLGQALLEIGAAAEAVEVLRPFANSTNSLLNLGAAHERLGDWNASVAAYESAIRLVPTLHPAWLALGNIRAQLNDGDGALQAYNRAVALQPLSPQAHLLRGKLFTRLGRYSEAVASFCRCVALDPKNRGAQLALANARGRLCDWPDMPTLRRELIEPALQQLDGPELLTPFFLLGLPGLIDQRELLAVAAKRSARVARHASTRVDRATNARPGPLRIGYLSPDFGNHAVGNCLRTLFARHDRSRVSVHAFSLADHPEDDFRREIRAGCDSWHDLVPLADRAASQLLADQGLDLLVDLAGHTKGNRIQLFAARPAPVQVTWLGYPGTTGAPFIDYLLADEFLIPPEEEAAFSERIVRLPGSYLPTDDSIAPAAGGDSREENGLPATGFVFCAFNNAYKIEPFIFGAWMEILRQTPGSWLWLRSAGPVADANLRREATERGIDPARLHFDSRSLPRPEHLARHRAAGLYLDTHFYNAHSTAADALRAGLPVLTLPGNAFPSRVGLSLVSTLGLADELAATSRDDYIGRAVSLASTPDRLTTVRRRLADAVAKPGGLFDTTAFARKLEDVFERICQPRG